jgi:hypothetical protein
MLKRTLLIFAILCAAILFGCSKSETMENSNTAMSNSNKPATVSTPATTTSTTTSSTNDEKIGVPECDEFIAKYEACTSKVPEIARAQYKSAVEQWRSSWKKLAANPATKGTLAAACKQAAEQQAAAWKAYGCAN